MKYLSYLIVAAAIGLNLYLYYPETQILADPNDNAFQFSLVQRTNWVWENYGCPFSLSCLPNLIDHNVPTWAEGYPLPFYYSHLPQIAIVASYNMFVAPISSLYPLPFTLYAYYNWTKYLLLCFFPLSVFLALRVVGFTPVSSALGALFAAHFSTDGLYGIDPPSFLWRGYGLTSQLYAMMFLPLGIAYAYKTMRAMNLESGIWNLEKGKFKFKIQNSKFQIHLLLPILFLTLTTAGHLGLGMIGLLSTIPFLFPDINLRNILKRAVILACIGGGVIFLLSYWIIPAVLYNNYHIISFWDPIWKFNSYGWYEVFRQFLQGEIFDWGRQPIVTTLVFIGFFASALSKRRFPFALLFSFFFLLYFGRTTWGGLLNIIPGMADFHQHRFLVGIQVAGIFLIPMALEQLYSWIKQSYVWILNIQSKVKSQKSKVQLKSQNNLNTNEETQKDNRHSHGILRVTQDDGLNRQFVPDGVFGGNMTIAGLFILLLVPLIYFTIHQTVEYNSLNTKWIYEAATAYRSGETEFQNLRTRLAALPNGRVYAGRPGNWGKQLRLGSSELYMLLGTYGFDMSQFLPETWSPMSENEQNFDERVPEDYDLLNIRYIVADKNQGFPSTVQMVDSFGPFQLFEAQSSGWFSIVSSPMAMYSDKTNFINFVHVWHRSYPRPWKMHPIISVEPYKLLPFTVKKQIKTVDEANYTEGNIRKNLFADFPFVFPEATVSGILRTEKIDKQSYTATIDVPQNCPYCMIMFKMSYHPDWHVTVDGQPAEKYAVFPFYLATPTTPGTHTIEWIYYPNTLKILLLGFEIVVLSCVGLWFVKWKIK